MSFPSSTGTVQDNLATAWERARSVAAQVKSRAQSLQTAAAAGPVSSGSLLDFSTFLADMKLLLQRSASTAGIAAYAQEQIADSNLNVVDEFNTMLSRIDSTTAWILANFPKDGSGFLLARQFAADNSGRTQDRQFTSIQTATLRTALGDLIASVD